MAKNHHGTVEDHWRNSNDYRAEYFKHNPGFLGYFYWCSQCFKPITRWDRENHQVDHMVAPSIFAHKKRDWRGNIKSNNSFLARLFNNEFNLVSICPECNQKKKDKAGKYLVKAWISKCLEVVIFSTQKAVFFGASFLLKLVWWLIAKLARAAVSPFSSSIPWYAKVALAGVYAGFLIYLFHTYVGVNSSDGFDAPAWLNR